jgi:hypothetical protein
VPFQSLKKTLKKNFKQILYNLKYGDDQRLPLRYIKTYTNKPSSYYKLPNESINESLSSYQAFPKLSQEILVALFSSIGVHYVPEVVLHELSIKTPQQAFSDFCMMFGEEEEGFISNDILNQVISKLQEMDVLRTEVPFDSRAIYNALAYQNFEEVDRLIDEMKQIKNENKRINR